MRIGTGNLSYEWVENWARIRDTEGARTGWSHHGIVVTRAGDVISGHQDGGSIQMFDSEGNMRRSFDTEVTEAHGLTLVEEEGAEYLWIADNGRRRLANLAYQYPQNQAPVMGQVVKTSLSGETLTRLHPPELAVYQDGDYMPTSVAVNEERYGGNGDIWVADGYGQSYVHRYNKAGNYVGSINGEEGEAGAFDCPHAVFIDRRKSEPELYVADRGNARVQVFDLEGGYKCAFGSEFLTSPSAFVTHGDLMVIAELRARLAVIDAGDGLVCYLGDNSQVANVDGWPNNTDVSGKIVRPRLLEPGKFNSPHGLAVDRHGNLYSAEWLIGGRYTKLVR